MGTVYAEDGDLYPNQMYLFVMDASPKSLRVASASSRDEEARVRAASWIQWHLDQVRREQTVEWLLPKTRMGANFLHPAIHVQIKRG